MRIALAGLVAAALLLPCALQAQDLGATYSKLQNESRRIANGAEALRDKLDDRGDLSGRKLGEQILRGVLSRGEDRREARDPIFTRLVEQSDALARAGADLSVGQGAPDVDAERSFIRQFRQLERTAMDADRVLTRVDARRIMTDQVKPGLLEIRHTLPTLTASRERQDRHEFYGRGGDRM